jgi:tyrosine-protein kinase Etk/Wzc
MNDPHSPATKPNEPATVGYEINLIDLLTGFARRKKLLLGMPIAFALCAALGSLALPNIYKATTTVLPSKQTQSNAIAMLNQLGGFGGSTPGALNISIPDELYLSMLRSISVADKLIQRFDLNAAYGLESTEATRQLLASNTAITIGRDRLIAIAVQDKDSKRAPQIANAYVEELLILVKRMALTEASHRRLFYERQLQSVKAQLAQAELEFNAAPNMAKSVNERDRTLVERAANLRAQISAKEIQLGVMQTFVTVNNQEYNRGQQRIGAMRAELARLENQDSGLRQPERRLDTRGSVSGIMKLQDIKYFQLLYELLAQQYEVARIDEAKDSSLIQVLDKAVEPEHYIKPKRKFTVLISAGLGLFLAALWVLIFDVVEVKKRLRMAQQLLRE